MEGPWEFGKFEQGGQGSRNDISRAVDLIKNNNNWKTIINECPREYVKYHSGLEKVKQYVGQKRDWKTEVILIVGPSGSGKSRYARETYPTAYWKPVGKWWNGYDGEEDVVFDEFDWQVWERTYLLNLFDRYPMLVETKGGYVQLIAKRIIITCKIKPWEDSDFEMMRRIDKIVTKCNEVVGNTSHNL